MRRLLRTLLTLCLFGAWTASSVGVVYAEALVVGSPSIGVHVESTDAAGGHAAAHSDDCALCQLLQVVGDVPSPIAASMFAQPVAGPMTGLAGGHEAPVQAGPGARAPPEATR